MKPTGDVDEVCHPCIHEASALSLAFHVDASIRGRLAAPFLNRARSAAKKAIRLMARIAEEGREVPPELPRLCTAMCDFLFTAIMVTNKRRGLDGTPCLGKSHGSASRSA